MKLHDLIPDLRPSYEALKAFVKEKQGEKGYIDTKNENGEADDIFGFIYDYNIQCGVEKRVAGVRVSNEDEIEILFEENPNLNAFSEDMDWELLDGIDVYYTETLLHLLENIEQYV